MGKTFVLPAHTFAMVESCSQSFICVEELRAYLYEQAEVADADYLTDAAKALRMVASYLGAVSDVRV